MVNWWIGGIVKNGKWSDKLFLLLLPTRPNASPTESFWRGCSSGRAAIASLAFEFESLLFEPARPNDIQSGGGFGIWDLDLGSWNLDLKLKPMHHIIQCLFCRKFEFFTKPVTMRIHRLGSNIHQAGNFLGRKVEFNVGAKLQVVLG